jgi:hypothetical protein
MDRRDHPERFLGGADCAACGSSVPASRVRLLAERDDLVFAELGCASCGSVSLAIVVKAAPTPDAPIAREGGARDDTPVGADDVLDMHEFLAGYSGDARGLLGPRRRGDERNRRTGAA